VIRESKDKDAVSALTWDDFKKMNLTQHISPQVLLSPSISLSQTGNPPFHIPSKNQAQLLLFVCAKVSMLATWHPCQSMQSAAETTRQQEYEALVCVSELQVITETIRLCNPIGLLWCKTKYDVPMQGNESLFPSFSGFWFSLLLTISAKQGWRYWHATTNHCCTFAFDP
jgi:hypothetical protein